MNLVLPGSLTAALLGIDATFPLLLPLTLLLTLLLLLLDDEAVAPYGRFDDSGALTLLIVDSPVIFPL